MIWQPEYEPLRGDDITPEEQAHMNEISCTLLEICDTILVELKKNDHYSFVIRTDDFNVTIERSE